MAALSLEAVRILVEAGATPASAVRAAEVLARGGSIDEAHAEIELELPLRTTISIDGLLAEVFQSEIAICREDGGGGNRTRVTCHPDSPLSSENASSSSDDDPSPSLVTPPRSMPSVELASPTRRAEP